MHNNKRIINNNMCIIYRRTRVRQPRISKIIIGMHHHNFILYVHVCIFYLICIHTNSVLASVDARNNSFMHALHKTHVASVFIYNCCRENDYEMPMSEYEIERMHRIAQNKQKLAEIMKVKDFVCDTLISLYMYACIIIGYSSTF